MPFVLIPQRVFHPIVDGILGAREVWKAKEDPDTGCDRLSLATA
jgi:hypothetical protein